MDSDMSLTRRIGTLLREAREAKKLSVSEVSRETNIIPKYIQALEKEDYSQFPGETYALGFLRSYCEYLGLDTNHVIGLYRGHQIDQSQTPVKELTKPIHASPIPGLDLLLNRNNQIFAGIILVALLLIAGIVYGVSYIPADVFSFSGGGSPSGVGEKSVCDGRDVVPITLAGGGGAPRSEDFTLENTMMFVVDTMSLKLCLEKIEQPPGSTPVGHFQLDAGDKGVYQFQAVEGEAVVLDQTISQLSSASREIRVTPQILGDVSARVELLSTAGEANVDRTIRVTLEFTQESYIEWTNDGNFHRGTKISAGETRVFEASNRLEIKVGNGAGVRIIQEGKPPRRAGPPGKIVNISYRKVPDPLDPGLSRVKESIEVVP